MSSYTEYSDNECIELFLSDNDKSAFAELFNRYFDNTYGFVYSRVGNKVWTEEIVSETFCTLIKAIKLFNGKSTVRTFIFGVALNKIKQFWYKKYKEKEIHLNEDIYITDPEIEGEDEYRLLEKLPMILDKLPDNYKAVLTERFLHEKSVKETATALNITEENVRVIQNRALRKAAQIGEEYLHEETYK